MTGNNYMGDVIRPEYWMSPHHDWQRDYGALDAPQYTPAGAHKKYQGEIWSGPIPQIADRECKR